MSDPVLTAELAALLDAIGSDGGLVSPAVYDTACVLRANVLTADEARGVVEWLLAEQADDGGFGLAWVPRARTSPTLAVVLALAEHASPAVDAARRRALAFLAEQAALFTDGGDSDALPDDIPVGLELALPRLLDQAVTQGLAIDPRPYRALYRLGERRRALIAAHGAKAGSAPAHTFEGWGTEPSPHLLDASGGVGHSPAATACWLALARGRDDLAAEQARARRYLAQASACTKSGVFGVVPTVWPIDRFEQVWALYAVRTLGLGALPGLERPFVAQLASLAAAVRPEGLGMSDAFTFDGDITSTALATLGAPGEPASRGGRLGAPGEPASRGGRLGAPGEPASRGGRLDGARTSLAPLERFARDGLFITYAAELQPSLTTNAHALHALSSDGRDAPLARAFLLGRQASDGRFCGDKWHSSWLYTTAQVTLCLGHAPGDSAAAEARAIDSVLAAQRNDGSFGAGPHATAAETAYAMHLLCRRDTQAAEQALARARAWLLAAWRASGGLGQAAAADRSWIGKELYCPLRVDRAWILSALLAAAPAARPAAQKAPGPWRVQVLADSVTSPGDDR